MPDTKKKTVRLSDFRERKMAEAIEMVTDDDQTFLIPPLDLWPDEVDAAMPLVDRCRLILGADDWDRFVAAGGTATIMNAVWRDRESLDLGEAPASPPS